jgi:type IV pilus assembly protein PilW
MIRLRTQRNLQSGLGLIEIMIALLLGAIIMLGVTEIATQNSLTRNELERFGRQLETATYAMRVIESDVTNAAFWGERGEYPAGATAPPICIDDADELEEAMGYPIQGGQGDITGCSGVTGNKLEPKSGTDFIAIRRVSSCADLSPGCPTDNSHFHLQVHACFDTTSALKPGDSFQIGQLPHSSNLEQRDCSTAAPSYRFLNHIYFVNDDDKLIRAQLSGTTYSTEELVENVETMRFEYGLDTDGDGQVDDYMSNVSDPNNPTWGEVVIVRLGLIVRNHQPSAGFNDARTYTVSGQTYTPATKQNHRRQLYTRTISARNIGGRREDP